MKLVEINWQPGDRQLRQFGIICFFALPGMGWIWGFGTTTIAVLTVIGLILAMIGAVSPSVLKPLFLVLTIVSAPIGMVIGELALFMIFIGVFLPLGLVFRMAGRDSLQLRLDRDSRSYWVKKKQPTNIASYYRQS